MKNFRCFYVWAMNTKFFMGIYFVALVMLTSFILALFGKEAINFMHLVQLLILAIFTALTQVYFLPDNTNFLKGLFFKKSVVWLLLVGISTGVAAHLGGWFNGLPKWCPWILALFMVVSCIAMLVGLRFEQEQDTIHLNQDLDHYKKNK